MSCKLHPTAVFPTLVKYSCATSRKEVGKVVKSKNGKWFLYANKLGNRPIEVFSKVEGFLLLSNLHKGTC